MTIFGSFFTVADWSKQIIKKGREPKLLIHRVLIVAFLQQKAIYSGVKMVS